LWRSLKHRIRRPMHVFSVSREDMRRTDRARQRLAGDRTGPIDGKRMPIVRGLPFYVVRTSRRACAHGIGSAAALTWPNTGGGLISTRTSLH